MMTLRISLARRADDQALMDLFDSVFGDAYKRLAEQVLETSKSMMLDTATHAQLDTLACRYGIPRILDHGVPYKFITEVA